MTDVDDINTEIAANAQRPRSSSKDGENVQEHAIQDQIAAAQHLAAQSAASQPHFGLRFTKLIPPGAGG